MKDQEAMISQFEPKNVDKALKGKSLT